jgi:hypothetical protein
MPSSPPAKKRKGCIENYFQVQQKSAKPDSKVNVKNEKGNEKYDKENEKDVAISDISKKLTKVEWTLINENNLNISYAVILRADQRFAIFNQYLNPSKILIYIFKIEQLSCFLNK